MGKEEINRKNGQNLDKKWEGREHCSLIIFPVQPGPLGIEVLLLVSGDKPGLPLLGTLGWNNAEEEGTQRHKTSLKSSWFSPSRSFLFG